jgi:hypothetical protein
VSARTFVRPGQGRLELGHMLTDFDHLPINIFIP